MGGGVVWLVQAYEAEGRSVRFPSFLLISRSMKYMDHYNSIASVLIVDFKLF